MTKPSKRSKQPSAVFRAVLARDRTALEAALRAGDPVDARERDGRTPLHHAAFDGDVGIAEMLLDAGADPTAVDRNGWTPLHFAAQEFRVELARMLLARGGAVVDAVDENGNTPLWRAVFASRGRGEMVMLLRTSGADRGRKNLHGVSPVDLARSISNYDVLRWLA